MTVQVKDADPDGPVESVAVTVTVEVATVVVVPRGKNKVLWQGDEQLQSVPGNHIPGMARKLGDNLRKSVKEARKASKDSSKNR